MGFAKDANNAAARAMAIEPFPFLRLPFPSDSFELLLVVDDLDEERELLGVTLPSDWVLSDDFLVFFSGEGDLFLAGCEFAASACL